MIVIVDYDTGNTLNVKKALEYLAIDNQLSADPAIIMAASGLILPGVGAFKTAMNALQQRHLVSVIQAFAATGKPLLGICLGMQLLFDRSEEFGETQGLGLIPGQVVAIPTKEGISIPHMGWNTNTLTQDDPFAAGFANQATYFVHSYYVQTKSAYTLATTDYGQPLTSIVRRQNILGTQFHPEKSGAIGLAGLQRFKEMTDHATLSSH
ncbi:imidazole glycerol phosphate synthase subunit HisH [Lacticaseibacillus casei]|jgi:glutamine amidotransferase|uniref:Imidazole glycerol phosphate synthase subunit HisH n=1 Tax=Lacticaseibacillus huelsenbergensis TaxID=3035291 RepID=A0ABY8DQX9_9LACO|nr:MULTISPECIES: imidazole glycerol phosphate synthase subunit HisH [Lacticaseibacillus]MDG3061744.1 imidazole glycerol phosphate synthase subunit HisH [Lacticaseibacillus sp. BCRC 81376]QVI37803.1 imidazole glycerol phosphate synthase subunit HisH [Lacticaseibacillus casei]QXG59594.1 imidazole glycerol phosphate synthase subunit HisH [Lacticaseibacillus casei]WFB38942.1 imidazole glycerol phosphate synthase subunit HisH [Lacticaseibacillus huelsenbergensis]WFB43336.1 imidazole glycerol phosph